MDSDIPGMPDIDDLLPQIPPPPEGSRPERAAATMVAWIKAGIKGFLWLTVLGVVVVFGNICLQLAVALGRLVSKALGLGG